MLGEPTWSAGCSRRLLAGATECPALSRLVGDGRPRDEPCGDQREVLVPTGEVEVAELAPRVPVSHDDHLPALPVSAARGEASGVEDLVDEVVGHRAVGEGTDRSGGAQGFYQVHGNLLCQAATGRRSGRLVDPADHRR